MFKKILVGVLAVIGISTVLLVGCTLTAVNTVDNAIEETERKYAEDSNEIQVMINEVQWTKNGEYLKGTFTNTSDKTISCIDAQVKFYNNENVVVSEDYINETNIAPGESRVIKLWIYDVNYETLEVIIDNNWSCFE